MPNSLDRKELAKRNQKLKKELAVWRSNAEEMTKLLEKAALYIRQRVKDSQMNTPWPLAPEDLVTLKACIPDDRHHFLTVLLTGDPTNVTPSARVCRLSDSMSQDIVYNVSCGRQKTLKHVLLAYGIKTLTGNVELIQMVNRLGHGISYHQLEESDTALCLQKLACALNERVVLPQHIQPYVFTN
ncbi:hypothetical protein ACOMHN_008089 [Nucella lapillus]